MNQRIRKLTMHRSLHPRDDVDRLYVSRKQGGRGLASIKNSVDASIQRLEDYSEKYERGLITTIRNDTDNTIDDRMTKTRKQKWEKKQLYGLFKGLINNISHQKIWTWLRKGNLKREMVSLLIATQNIAGKTNHIKARIDKTQQNRRCRLYGNGDEIAAQNNAIRTNLKARIDKTQQNSKCRLCSDRNETTNHIISECSKLVQKEYKARHDWVGKVIHWEMCKKFKFDHTN